MIRDECEQCGARNVVGALFCSSCRAYLGWDVTSSIGAGGTPGAVAGNGWSTPTLVAPASAEALRALLAVNEVTVTPRGEPADVEIAVNNQSDIVDAYLVDVPDAPPWLDVTGSRVRLMPGTSGSLTLNLRVGDGVLPVAQRLEVGVRVRSEVDDHVAAVLTLAVEVAAIDRPVALRVEPSVIRVKDEPSGEFALVVDNSASNRAAHLQLAAHDAERVMAVTFTTPSLDLAAGEIATVHARLEAPLPDAGEETSRQLTITAFDGSRTSQAVVTFAQRSSRPVADPPMTLRLHPSVVSALDAASAELRLDIDNSSGRDGAQVTLGGYDPEASVRFDFSAPTVDVAPGATTSVTVRVTAAQPEAGVETARPFTVSARYAAHTIDAGGTFRQRTTAAAIDAVRLRVEPPVVRVRDGARGRIRVIADNRSGVVAARMWLTGKDSEGTAAITFAAPYVDVYPGQQAAVDAEVRAPRPPDGTEHSRTITVTGTDGQHEITADGTFAQTASDRRPMLRTLFTVAGGLAMILGAFLPWTSDPVAHSGVQWTIPALTSLFDSTGPKLNSAVAKLACAGAVIILLGALAIWGRLGTQGRLTRQCALLGLLLTVGFLIFVHVRVHQSTVAVGAMVVMIGCVSAYVGGQLARR